MKVMGTGSRSMLTEPNAKEIYQNLETYILILKEKDPDLVLISGMAEGWDEAIAKVGLRNKIPYIVALPNDGYGDYYWTPAAPPKKKDGSLLGIDRRSTFRDLVSHAEEIVFVCKTVYVNGVHANFIRNQWMVDQCDMALVYNPQSSGTRDAVGKLKTARKPYSIYPFSTQLTLEIK